MLPLLVPSACTGGVADFLPLWSGGDTRELEAIVDGECLGDWTSGEPTMMEPARSFWEGGPLGAARIDPISGVPEGCLRVLSLSHALNGSFTTFERFLIALRML